MAMKVAGVVAMATLLLLVTSADALCQQTDRRNVSWSAQLEETSTQVTCFEQKNVSIANSFKDIGRYKRTI